jgi:GxxExxY protein
MRNPKLIEGGLTRSILGAFYEVYNTLGFGFLEHLYVMALERELLERRHRVAREVCMPVMYKGLPLGMQRIDMIVDNKVIVETKSTAELHRAASRQVLNYLRATGFEVGLLLHFGPEPKFHRLVSSSERISAPSAVTAKSASNLGDSGQPEEPTAEEPE